MTSEPIAEQLAEYKRQSAEYGKLIEALKGRIAILEQELAEKELSDANGNGADAGGSVCGWEDNRPKGIGGTDQVDSDYLVHDPAATRLRSGRGGLPFRYREGI
jgi:hypothetical protein